MGIDIYTKYEVKLYNEGSYISEEDSLPGDIAFSKYKHSEAFVWDGVKLIDYIGNLLTSEFIQSFNIVEDVLAYPLMFTTELEFEFFNPSSGEGHNIKIHFREYKGVVND